MRTTILLLLFHSAVWPTCTYAADITYTLTQRLNNPWPVKSWYELVTQDVVMQNFDYSCGAAALATILSKFYNQPVTESIILDALGKTTTATFADLSAVLPQFGFKGIGVAVSPEQLAKLKIPVIMAVRFSADNEHFSVLRGIDADTAWLADPSIGSQRLPLDRFLYGWQNRSDPQQHGKILIVLPNTPAEHPAQQDYFGAPPLADPLDSAFGGQWQQLIFNSIRAK